MRLHTGNTAEIPMASNMASHEMLMNNTRFPNREVYDRYANAVNENLKEGIKEELRSQKSEMSPERKRKGSTISPLSPSTNSSQQRRRSVLKKSNKVTISQINEQILEQGSDSKQHQALEE